MKIELSRYAPPGLNLRPGQGLFVGGMVTSILLSVLRFFSYFVMERAKLYTRPGVLIPGNEMADFVFILGDALTGFFVLALCMLAFIFRNYAYFHSGSRSVYLMKRLPDPWERHRLCLTLPLAAAGVSLLAAFVLLCIYYAVYMLCTPAQCLQSGQWQKIWSVLR